MAVGGLARFHPGLALPAAGLTVLAAAPPPALASAVIRHALVPMAVFYLILMAALGSGLLGLRRGAAGRSGGPAVGDRGRRGWPAFARRVLPTVLGGYLLLLAMVTAYYYLVARVGGDFLSSAVTGTALLIGITLPVYAATAWLAAKTPDRTGEGPKPPP